MTHSSGRPTFSRTILLSVLFLMLYWLPGVFCAEAFAGQGNTSSVVVENGVPKLAINGKAVNNMFAVEIFCAGMDAEKPQFLTEIKRAIDKTAALKIPIFSFEILWNDFDHSTTTPVNAEEAAGRFNTKVLDTILDYAAEKRVYVLLELLKHQHWALPAWWKSYKSNLSGIQMLGPPNTATEAYNRLQSPVASYMNPDHHELLDALIRKLVSRYKNHPAVFGYGINVGPTGENGYIPSYIELMFNKSVQVDPRSVMGDYSITAKKNFITYLKNKYSSIGELNRKWNSSYKNFDEITPPYPVKSSSRETFGTNGDARPEMREWQWFRNGSLVEEWRFLSNLVRSLDPEKVIIGKTNWNPLAVQTGTEFMQISSVPVNSQKLIDIDKMDANLFLQDYMDEFQYSMSYSKLDYVHISRFSKKYGLVRIYNVDNNVKKSNPAGLDVSIALPIKDLLKKEGCYMWFPVVLESDKHDRPDWKWSEIEALVKKSGTEELKGAAITEPAVKFYFDMANQMPHYYDSLPGLSSNGLAFALSKAFYDSDPQPVSFLSSDDLASAAPDPQTTKLLVLANQRVIPPGVAANLLDYSSRGGTVLLLGSNGIFDFDARKDASSIRRLVPAITDLQVMGLYEWGTAGRVKIPCFVVSRGKSQFVEIDLSADPSQNYQVLANALPSGTPVPKKGRLIFVTTEGRPTLKHMSGNLTSSPSRSAPMQGATPEGQYPSPPVGPVPPGGYQGGPVPPQQYGGAPMPAPYAGGPQPQPIKRDFLRHFDKNGDGVVTRNEFNGPQELWDRLDTNRDNIITADEAQWDR